jgi:uncharacterized protein YcaQ
MRLPNREKYLGEVLDFVRQSGPVTSHDLPPVPGPKRRPGDWHRSVPRWALEVHFGRGAVAVTERMSNFQRVYDLPERLIEASHYGRRVDAGEAQRELLRCAARACGVATLHDLADYYRMSPRDARPRLAELVEEGSLTPVSVEGWKEPAYLSPDARCPRAVRGATLLSPFDPVVWFRRRAERLFDFHYRIEIYVPEKKRRWGYYVLPFLLDERIVARVDLKADRKEGALLVQSAHPEENIDRLRVVEELAAELESLAAWLGLRRIVVKRRDAFARELAERLR